MRLESCDNCAIVLDLDKMRGDRFSDKYGNETTGGYESFECPLCDEDITVEIPTTNRVTTNDY